MALGKLVRCFQLPTRQRAKQGLWLRATVPGVGLLTWLHQSLGLPPGQPVLRGIDLSQPCFMAICIDEAPNVYPGCSHEMELVGEPLKCIYSLRPMLLTSWMRSNAQSVASAFQVRKGSLCELALWSSEFSRCSEAIVACMMLRASSF